MPLDHHHQEEIYFNLYLLLRHEKGSLNLERFLVLIIPNKNLSLYFNKFNHHQQDLDEDEKENLLRKIIYKSVTLFNGILEWHSDSWLKTTSSRREEEEVDGDDDDDNRELYDEIFIWKKEKSRWVSG